MNSSRTTSRLAIVALSVLAACVPAFATGTDSKTITVVGHVTPVISITADLLATDLDIMLGAIKTPLISVTEFSNYKGGYAVTLTSAKQWKLGQTSGTGSQSWAYTLFYGANVGAALPVTLPSSGAATLTAQTGVSGKSLSTGTPNVLYISFDTPAANILNADTYNDTLVFTITGT
ncbi:MAG: hypothetical protein ACOYM2_08465 [Rectinemataceae bacterium]